MKYIKKPQSVGNWYCYCSNCNNCDDCNNCSSYHHCGDVCTYLCGAVIR